REERDSMEAKHGKRVQIHDEGRTRRPRLTTEDFSGFGGAQGQGPVGFDARAGGAVAYEEGEHVRPRLLAGGVQDEVLALVGLRTRSDEASGHAPRRRAPEEPARRALERPRAVLRLKARLDLVVRSAVPAAEAIDFDV